MTDRLTIPAESWRPRPRTGWLDPQAKLIALAAAGLLGVAVLGYGGYHLLANRPHTVPVVEADPRPLRVRPDNPGGMQLVGADERAGTEQPAMAPPPETPAPQALRAKINAETQAAATSSATSNVQPVSLVNPPPEPPAQLSAMPEQPAPPTAKPITQPVARSAALAKTAIAAPNALQVQLAAMGTEQAAMVEWQRLSHRMPDLLGPRQPAVQRAERDGRVVYRLRTGGFTDTASATAFCAQIRSKGADCSIASF